MNETRRPAGATAGSVMVGLPSLACAAALVRDLRHAGWSRESLRHFDPETPMAQIGSRSHAHDPDEPSDPSDPSASPRLEPDRMRRYLQMAGAGHEWLLVRVKDRAQAASAAALARSNGATLAVHYRAPALEELL